MPAPRTLIIGDVHGCLDELRALVRKARLAAGDRVVLVGDLVAKGPDSLGVVQLAREEGWQAVLGNHDAHLLAAKAGAHAELREAMDPASLAWMQGLPLWLRPEGHPVVVVHAGLVPGVPLEDQRREDLLTMRAVRPDGTGSKRAEDGALWATRWPGPEHVVFGHDAVRGLQRHPHATGLDTGCVYGKCLTALLLPEWELISVPARRAYLSLDD
jgi:hypothetical protein